MGLAVIGEPTTSKYDGRTLPASFIKFGEFYMKWYKKFKVGQRVRVVKKVDFWKVGGETTRWNSEGDMDRTIGKVYIIKGIRRHTGFQLQTREDVKHKCNYWYPVESLTYGGCAQLLFDFMSE